MPELHFTNHAEDRMRQRGLRKADVGLVLSVATQITDDAFFLTDKDAAREIERRRREIQQLERLRGSKFIVESGALITLYHTTSKSLRAVSKRYRRQS